MDARRLCFIGYLSVLLLAACADYQLMGAGVDGGFDRNPDSLTFAHPFTEKGYSEVRAEAKKLCGFIAWRYASHTKECVKSSKFAP